MGLFIFGGLFFAQFLGEIRALLMLGGGASQKSGTAAILNRSTRPVQPENNRVMLLVAGCCSSFAGVEAFNGSEHGMILSIGTLGQIVIYELGQPSLCRNGLWAMLR